MSIPMTTPWRVTLALSIVGTGMLSGHANAAQAPQNQGPPNPQDRTVKMAGQPATEDASGRPLDEQKSAPIQVVKRDYDLDKLTHEARVPEPVFRGRVLWLQKCAFCHDGLGQPTYKTMGPWLDKDLVATLTDDVIKIIVRTGTTNMPGFQYDLSASQMDRILDFLKSVPASDKPSPAQLAGRSEGGNSD